jgi:predicted AAA+ superfamily ATPase
VAVPEYVPRTVEPLVSELFDELPALLLVGPRATGKTTTAARRAATIVRLDREAEAAAFRADPDAALRGLDEPVLLDEWQAVPDVLAAVKRSVDADPSPGRFLLTGSVRADLDAATWPGTGRLVRVFLWPMSVAERRGHHDVRPLVDRIVSGDDLTPTETPDLRDYVEEAMQGGFPELLDLSDRVRTAWLESYVDQLVTRDAALADQRRDPARVRRYLEAVALNTAGLVDDQTLYGAAGINRRTAVAYDQLLINLFVMDLLPAWTTNRLKRLVQRPKRYLVDPALAVGILGVDVTSVLGDGDLLGRVLDTFVAAQLRTECGVAGTRPRLFHLRQQDGRREVDLLSELGADRIIGLEVKATAAPDPGDAKHLQWLRDEMGDRFVGGAVLHTGPRTYELAERIVAVPISTIWSGS